MGEGSYKAAKGLIRVRVQVETNKIWRVTISGDFFMHPEDKLWELERTLEETPTLKEVILAKVRAFYDKTKIITPGVNPEDFAEAIMRGVEDKTS